MAVKPLAAGEMGSRIRIEVQGRIPNGQGGFTTGWAPLAKTPIVWAKKIPLRGDESTVDSIRRSVSVARFLIRHRTDLTTQHRLIEVKKVGDTYEQVGGPWDIKRVDDPFGHRDRLEVDCEWVMGQN